MRDFSTHTQAASIFYLTVAQFVASLASRWLIFAELNIHALFEVDPLAVIAATRQDVTVALVAAAAAIAIQMLQGRRWPYLSCHVLLAFAMAHCFLLAVNAFAVRWIGAPLTLQWLYFADLLQTATPNAALGAVLSPRLLLLVTVLTALPLLALWLGRLLFATPPRRLLLGRVAASVTVLSVLFAASALVRPLRGDVFQDFRYSPVQALLSSAVSRAPAFDPCAAAVPAETLIPADPLPADVPENGQASSRKPNFVLVVLESVGAKALNANRPRLPNVDRMMRSGAVFTNTYATTASTTRSFFSLLTSRYPLVTFKPEIRELQQFEFVTLPEVLREAGYRTAYFGVDLKFQDVGSFIRAEGFDIAHEALDSGCESRRALGRDDYPSASLPDSCIFHSASDWAVRSNEPFFLTVWSNDSHAPYTTNGNFAGRLSRENYERGLVTTDAALGKLIDRLSRAGRLEDTIFVIVGDHGEAFGEHGRKFHSTTIFEEEVKVPLIVQGTPLGRRGTDRRLARLIDLAPSIVSLAGVHAEATWAGRDLFSPVGVNRVFFFTSYRGVQIGFREANTKYILDYERESFSKYQLDEDPFELRPIPLGPQESARAEAIAAAWVARERRRYWADRRANCGTVG